MLPAFGPLYYLFGLPWFFRKLKMEDHSAERVRRATDRGPIVYVLHTRSTMDWLALNSVLVGRRLPLPEFTPELDATPYMTPGSMWSALRRGRDVVEPRSGLLNAVAAGRPTCVFLAAPWDIRELVGAREEPDIVPALLAAQARSERPVQVLPVVVIWNKRPEPARTEVGRFVLGSEDNPGVFGKMAAIAAAQDAIIQVGEPVSLQDYVTRYAEESDARQAKGLRLALRRYLYREARVVRGPRARPAGWVRRQVLQSREIDELVVREVAATGQPEHKIRTKVVKTFDQIAAHFWFPVVRMAAWACWQIWNRVFSGIDVRESDLDRVREALRQGTPILVPCHRSHLDYLLISSLLFDRDICIPHIVAGDNLSFFPLGPIFRRLGAFFIKRSFTGDRIHPVVISRYIRELVRMEVPVEFFIEGGRSRTGKLLPPKTGVLGMVMDATGDVREGRELTFLPIYVGYEQIAEERVYARELSGVKKEKEDVTQVVKATSVLGNRYGKVYLRVGEPLRAKELLDGAEWESLPKPRREEILASIGEKILHRINTEAVALPTALVALAILAHPRRGLRHEDLRARVQRLRAFLAAAGVQEGGGIAHVDGILAEALGRFAKGKMITVFEEELGRVYSVVPDRRVTLEYYKNAVLHAFAPAAYYAAAVRALNADAVDRAAVSRLFSVQQFMLRYEFILDPDAHATELEARAVHALEAYGALRVEGEQVIVADRGRVAEIANLTANFLESYLLAMRTAKEEHLPLKQLADAALKRGKTLLACDEISRPEALNLQNLQNAMRALKEDGVLKVADDQRVVVEKDAWGAYHTDLCFLLGLEERVDRG